MPWGLVMEATFGFLPSLRSRISGNTSNTCVTLNSITMTSSWRVFPSQVGVAPHVCATTYLCTNSGMSWLKDGNVLTVPWSRHSTERHTPTFMLPSHFFLHCAHRSLTSPFTKLLVASRRLPLAPRDLAHASCRFAGVCPQIICWRVSGLFSSERITASRPSSCTFHSFTVSLLC